MRGRFDALCIDDLPEQNMVFDDGIETWWSDTKICVEEEQNERQTEECV